MTRRSIALIIHDGVQALDVAGPLDVVALASGMLADDDGYDVTIVASETGAIRASNGMAIVADAVFAGAATVFDTAIVAGGPKLIEQPMADMHAWFVEWGSKAGRHGSVSTGAFALGRAGLLDGKVATTDQREAPRLAAMFPASRIVNDGTVVRDGRLITSAGAGAAVELGLELVAEDHGPNLALTCARHLGDKAVGSRPLRHGAVTDTLVAHRPLARVLDHIRANLGDPLPVKRLACVAAMSSRSLARLFAVELGTTPHDFVETRRLELAQTLLRTCDASLKVLAHRCGFGGAEQLRVVFQRRLGMSPTFYRDQFRSTDAGGPVARGCVGSSSPRPPGC